ncbi:NAD(P)/FAD-dependent oxidoreductase [Streptomyces sp. NPDC007088]|uniref:NAD(P)/FAD-dependent oxidoreductase n=1 Tax=Streptomyces sp. NPDC007088 TaxID=3364773 RepID=UPI00367C0BA1
MYTALRLQRKLKDGEAEVVLVTPDPYLTYQPFLPEAAAGSLSPRHVVVPLRRVLTGCRLLLGEVVSVDHATRTAYVETPATEDEGGGATELAYDEIVLAPGSVSRTLPVPGLAEHGIGFTTVEEAIGLRNHVLEQLDIASSTRDPALRDAALTFVFVGAGYAGVEALAELEDMAGYASRHYHNLERDDMRWVLVEAGARILPEVAPELGTYALRALRRRGVDVRLGTRLSSCEQRVAALDDGTRLPTRTLVWTTGVRPHPLLAACDLPTDDHGRLVCTPRLDVVDTPHAWGAGNAAAVPDLTAPEEDRTCAPNAAHALQQARVLADNLLASLRGTPARDYRHRPSGSVATLGLHKGVAQIRGRKLTGYPAWFLHRLHHLGRVPTANRKARVLAEWTVSAFFTREIVSLGSLEHPRAEFERAAGGEPPPHPEGSF